MKLNVDRYFKSAYHKGEIFNGKYDDNFGLEKASLYFETLMGPFLSLASCLA